LCNEEQLCMEVVSLLGSCFLFVCLCFVCLLVCLFVCHVFKLIIYKTLSDSCYKYYVAQMLTIAVFCLCDDRR
jgi:peptidoglycan biosynthesis protein MviN/MurJ (putative lipid II flippase)